MQHLFTYWLAGFCTAAISALFWPILPHPLILAGLFTAACALHLFVRRRRRPVSFVPPGCQNSLPLSWQNQLLAVIGGALAGACWLASVGYWYITWQLPQTNNTNLAQISLQVSEQRPLEPAGCMIKGEIKSRRWLDAVFRPSASLVWQLPQPCPENGVLITVTGRFRQPVGLINPGASDSQRQFVASRLVLRGTIKSVQAQAPPVAASLHQRATDYLSGLALPNQRWSAALLVGHRQFLEAKDWQILKDSGTAHLFSISGMHLSLVALWAFWVTRLGLYGAARIGLVTRQPDTFYISAGCTLVACTAYTALANWQLPVCRALFLVLLFFILQAVRRSVSRICLAWTMLSAGLLLFPFAVFSASLYLSVGAVLFIWLWHWSARPRLASAVDKVRAAISMQLALTVLMVPLTLGWFAQQSLLAPVINLLLVPLIMVVLPLGVAALLISLAGHGAGEAALRQVDAALGLLMQAVASTSEWVAPLPLNIGVAALVCLLLAILLNVLPPFKGRIISTLILLLAPLSYAVPFNSAYWYVHVVDAGQGTAVVISRGRAGIILDTGPQFGDYSVARQQLEPLLTMLGIRQVDAIFISHLDNDHAGGLAHVQQLPQVSPATIVATALDRCQAGMRYNLLGLSVSAIWPPAGNQVDDNDHSCVLVIQDEQTVLLAPGDIERAGEYGLLYSGQLPQADILLAPHHGSQSSSGGRFVATTMPRWVVFTQGFNNRWGFPHASVVQRYRQHLTRLYGTGQHGYMRFAIREGEITVVTASQDLRQRWYHRREGQFN